MATINGTSGNDIINGGSGDDTINGLAGDDTLNGLDGDDILNGGTGKNTLNGGNGNDTLTPGTGNSVDDGGTADGGAGFDTLIADFTNADSGNIGVGGSGIINNDFSLTSRVGSTRLLSFDNFERFQIIGTTFNDFFTVREGDTFDGGAGIDSLSLNFATATSNLNLALNFNSTVNQLTYSGASVIKNFESLSEITTGSGNDVINIGNSNGIDDGGTVDGGGGTDTLIADFTNADSGFIGVGGSGITNSAFSFRTLVNSTRLLSFENIEKFQITGTIFNDLFTVKAGDTFDGGAGIDKLVLDFSTATNNLNLALNLNSTVNQLTYSGASVIKNFESLSEITTGSGNDVINIGNSNGIDDGGTVDGGGGSDTLIADFTNADSGNIGSSGLGISNSAFSFSTRVNPTRLLSFENIEKFQITGTIFNDTLQGFAGDDILNGNSGDDTVSGGDGNDILSGGLGNDTINGGNGIDTLKESGNVNFTLTNTTLTGLGTDTFTGIESVNLTGGFSNNILNASAFTLSAVTLDGGAGNDTLIGTSLNDTLLGGEGNDTLTGGLGNDSLNGGNGIDTVKESGNVNFTLTNTTLTGLSTDTLISIESANLTGGVGNNTLSAVAFTLGSVTLDGGAGNDLLIGGSQNDTLLGGEGNDTLAAKAGNDTVNGGNGIDIVTERADVNFTLTNSTLTGLGTDTLISIESAVLTGGIGNNILNASAFTLGAVTLNGDAGNDTLSGGSGNDSLLGGEGNDTLTGGLGNDSLNGGNGIDTVKGSGNVNFTLTNSTLIGLGTDTLISIESVNLTGGVGNNTLSAVAFGLGSVTLDGGAGDDLLVGGSQNDILLGGEGNDTLAAKLGNDTVNGGNGTDIVTERADVNFTLTNTTLTGLGTDTLISIESAVLTGGIGNNSFNALAFTLGAVTLNGDAGNDVLRGGFKNDTLLGGEGNDVLRGAGNNNGVGSIDTLTGGNGNDTFILSDSTSVFYNDGNNATSGLADYGLIKDFSSTLDKIQLEGAANLYVLGTSPIAGITGTAIYKDTNSNGIFNSTDELIAVAQGAVGLSLSSSYFTYV